MDEWDWLLHRGFATRIAVQSVRSLRTFDSPRKGDIMKALLLAVMLCTVASSAGLAAGIGNGRRANVGGPPQLASGGNIGHNNTGTGNIGSGNSGTGNVGHAN